MKWVITITEIINWLFYDLFKPLVQLNGNYKGDFKTYKLNHGTDIVENPFQFVTLWPFATLFSLTAETKVNVSRLSIWLC